MAVNSVTPAQQADITALYAAFWNRAPDTTGFGFWVQAYANGASLSSIATQFRADPEGIAAYPLASTNVQLITEVYQNVFDRAPDPTGLAFWTNALNTMTFPNVVISMVQAALKPGNSDGALFANKVQVGEYVAITVETDNYNVTSHAFDLVTANPASVKQAEAWVDTQVTGSSYDLTTKADVATAQYFDGSLNDHGQQTLQNFDQLTGQREFNKLDAQVISGYGATFGGVLSAGLGGPDFVGSYVTPELLKNIQVVDVQVTESGHAGNVAVAVGYCSSAAVYTYDTGATVDLRNANDVQVLVNDGSSATLTFNNVGSTLTDVTVKNVYGSVFSGADTIVNFAPNADITSVDLNLSNVNGYFYAANIQIDAPETVNINSTVLPSDVSLSLASATTLNISGDADLTIEDLGVAGTQSVSSINAGTFAGDLSIVVGDQSQVLSTTVITVNSGLGNDTIDMTQVSQNYIVTLGAGNDTLIDENITDTSATVVGGLGEDALQTTYASAHALTTANGIDGIDTLIVESLNGNGAAGTGADSGTLTVANVDSTITELEVTGGGVLSTQDTTVVGSAGNFLVELGSVNSGALDNTITFTDTGTATTDTLSIVNLALLSANNTNIDVFDGNDIASNGYENVTINTGAVSPTVGGQTIGNLQITADSASAPVNLTLTGTSGITIGTSSSNTTGLYTVNASGLNVLATATGLTYNQGGVAALGLGATQSITGSAGKDLMNLDYAGSMYGGAGNDTLNATDTFATATNQLVSGDAGNDTITGGAGNDTLLGGTGNDTIAVTSNLSSADVIDGGVGVDTLSVTAEITGTTGVGVVNFEVLQTTVSQAMTNTINNSGWTTVFANAGSVAITNALAAVTTYQVAENATGTHAFSRLVDTGTDSLTIASVDATTGGVTVARFDANDEESITINSSAGAAGSNALTITSLHASDLTSLTLTGDNDVTIGGFVGGATGLVLATVNASALTAEVDVNASASTAAMTFTGSTAYANTFAGGSKADVITGGSAEDYFTGNAGNDTVNFGGGASVADTWDFASAAALGTHSLGTSTVATAAEIQAYVGSDTISTFVHGVDGFDIDTDVFGTLIEGSVAGTLNNFLSVTSTTTLLSDMTGASIIVVQPTAGNASASIYYVDHTVASTQNLQTYIDLNQATLIGTVTSATGVLSAADFAVI